MKAVPLPASLFPLPLLLACTSITTRPSYRPFPEASYDTLTVRPEQVIPLASATLAAMGLQVRHQAAGEGYLETRWFNPETRRSASSNTHPRRQVRIRVFADLVTPTRSQVVVEAVYRRVVDPSVPDREDERVAAPGTPGDSLARELRRQIRSRAP